MAALPALAVRVTGVALAAVATSALLTGCAASDGGGEASCAGPYLDDQPPGGRLGAPRPTIAPGATLTVHGHWYTATCDDAGAGESDVPLDPVRLTLTLPDGSTRDLGTATPAPDGDPDIPDLGFVVSIDLPASTPTGVASVRDDRSPSAVFEFTIRP